MPIRLLEIKQKITVNEMFEKLESEVNELAKELMFGEKQYQLEETLDVIQSALSLLFMLTDDTNKLEQVGKRHVEKLKSRKHEILNEYVLNKISPDEQSIAKK